MGEVMGSNLQNTFYKYKLPATADNNGGIGRGSTLIRSGGFDLTSNNAVFLRPSWRQF